MPSVSRYRTWLAVPADEIEDLKKAHPPMNGHTPVIWDKEHKLWFARPGADLSRLDRWLPRPQDVSMNGSDPVTEFAQVLENAGLVLKELPVMDGKIHRVPTADDKKGQKSGAYRGFLDGRPAGWYRDYRSADDSPITWTFSGGEQTDPRARLHLKAHSMQRREDAERELKAQYNRQAAYARRYVNKWPQATAHEYLTRKGIQAAPGVRVNNKNELVIPFSNRNGAIRSYQRIPVTGGKDARILKDSEKTGNWFALGTPRNGQPVLFAEGYATAASLHEATGLPVLMTVDGGNMIAVAENARQKWTQSPFIFCADNDHAIRVNKGSDMDNAASEFVTTFLEKRNSGNGILPDIETRIQRAADEYERAVQKSLPIDNGEQSRKEALKSYLTTYGWVTLGAWYQTFATANQRLAELADRAPAVTSMSSLGEVGDTDLFSAVMGAYKTQLQNSTYTPTIGTITTQDESNAANSTDPQSVVMKSIAPTILKWTNQAATEWSGTGTTSNQVNPLIKMKNIGDYTLGTTEILWTGYTTVRVLATMGDNSIFGKAVNLFSGLPKGFVALLDAAAPPIYFLLFLLFCAGFSLSIYLPFIPFIFWMTGIGNWIVSVLIGCTAGPLWAATHLGTSEDRGSRAAYGYIYLIDSMIRPPLMVFGFFFASVAIIAVGTILNSLFGAALVNVQVKSLTGIFSLAGFLLIYARMCTTSVAAIFALQAYLPDHVINFLGGRDGVNTLGNLTSSVKDIFAGSNRNIRHSPGVREDRLKNVTKDDNKDGIKG